LLFDGESALRSRTVQDQIQKKYGITVLAEPHFKRNMAERGVREIKTRMAIILQQKSNFFCLLKN